MLVENLKQWREYVLERDDYMCTNCGITYGLEAHHVKQRSLYPELELETDNGLTLCHPCHQLVIVIKRNPVNIPRITAHGGGSELLTPIEVAKACHVARETVYRWIYNGKISSVKIVGVVRIRKDVLDEFLGIPEQMHPVLDGEEG